SPHSLVCPARGHVLVPNQGVFPPATPGVLGQHWAILYQLSSPSSCVTRHDESGATLAPQVLIVRPRATPHVVPLHSVGSSPRSIPPSLYATSLNGLKPICHRSNTGLT